MCFDRKPYKCSSKLFVKILISFTVVYWVGLNFGCTEASIFQLQPAVKHVFMKRERRNPQPTLQVLKKINVKLLMFPDSDMKILIWDVI